MKGELWFGIAVGLACVLLIGMGLLIGLANSEIKYMNAYNEQHCRPQCAGGDSSVKFRDGKFACLCTRVVP